MSINLKTHLNKDQRANEIVCASFLTWTGGNHILTSQSKSNLLYLVSMDGTSVEDETNCIAQSVVRQINNIPYPFKFEQAVQKESIKLELSKNERSLLNYVTGKLDSFLKQLE